MPNIHQAIGETRGKMPANGLPGADASDWLPDPFAPRGAAFGFGGVGLVCQFATAASPSFAVRRLGS